MTDSAPRVSVIVPAYNYGAFLGEALDSVLAQTMSDWECVIVDDGSTDDTAEVATRYAQRDSRFRLVRQPNRGLPSARNSGIASSRGTYLQFLDADDKLAPRKLETHASFLDSHPHADIVYSLATFFRTEEPEKVLYSLHGGLSRPLLQKVSGNAEPLARLQQFNIAPAAAMFMRRAAIARAGVFNEAASACEDWDFWLRCAIAGCTFEYVDAGESLAFIRTHPGSMSRSSERMMAGLIDAAMTFDQSVAAQHWTKPTLPAVYEMAMGVHAVENGSRLRGVRRILRAARAASSGMTRLRWRVYAAAGCILPRSLFHRLVVWPMPEGGLELLRRIKR
ncbi:MAG TPA: glycosyltransferase family A protein [Thermoanaerobaculia bacterium]|nr:glycosyltransferase family A protein [Thermoanaerobaculia bacterium]